jgi:hypothetical protein
LAKASTTWKRDFFLFHHTENGFGAHALSYPVNTMGYFTAKKQAAVRVDHSCPSNGERLKTYKQNMNCTFGFPHVHFKFHPSHSFYFNNPNNIK